MSEPPADALADELRRRYAHVAPAEGDRWPTALRVLDAALAMDLKRDRAWLTAPAYEHRVAGPVRAFREAHPQARTLAELRAAIERHPSPAGFARDALGVEPERGDLALAIVRVLQADLDAAAAGYADDEATALQQWADWQMGDAYVLPRTADGSPRELGWDYLRMRLGADDVVAGAPDGLFIREVLGPRAWLPSWGFGEAARQAGVPLLGTLRAIEADRVAGRAFGGRADLGAWTLWFEALANVLVEPFPPVDWVAELHATAPHRPDGARAAARGDATGALTALPALDPGVHARSAAATGWLVLLHERLAGRAFDVEVSGPAAQACTAGVAAELRAHGGADGRYLRALDAVAELRAPHFGLQGR